MAAGSSEIRSWMRSTTASTLVGEVLAGGRELDAAGAAVRGVGNAGDEVAAFEAVDHACQTRALDAQDPAELGHAERAGDQHAQQVGLLRGQAERPARLGVQVLQPVHRLDQRTREVGIPSRRRHHDPMIVRSPNSLLF